MMEFIDMKRRCLQICAVILLALLMLNIGGALAEYGLPDGMAEATQWTVDTANIVNGGAVAQGDGCTYYCSNGIWVKPDDGDPYMLWDVYATSLIYRDGMIYYTDAGQSNALYCRPVAGGEAKRIVPFSAEFFAFSGDELFFACVKRLEHRGLYRCGADGSDLTKLSDANVGFLLTTDAYLYYTDKDARNALVRTDHDGQNQKTLIDEYVYCALIHEAESKMYFSTTKAVYSCGLDGKGARIIMPIPANALSIGGTDLFMAVYSYTGKVDYSVGIFRIGSGDEKMNWVRQNQASMLCVGSGKLYYKNVDEGFRLMRCDFSGANPVYVASGEADSILDQVEEANRAQENNQ